MNKLIRSSTSAIVSPTETPESSSSPSSITVPSPAGVNPMKKKRSKKVTIDKGKRNRRHTSKRGPKVKRDKRNLAPPSVTLVLTTKKPFTKWHEFPIYVEDEENERHYKRYSNQEATPEKCLNCKFPIVSLFKLYRNKTCVLYFVDHRLYETFPGFCETHESIPGKVP
uniref:Uncharacterized protein n=1 Tax=Romanomermis culicivorax TaxID=13658 RepID=A0A915ICK6_ROMCU